MLTEGGLIKVWLTKNTAKYLELLLGSLDTALLSDAIDHFSPGSLASSKQEVIAENIAVPVLIKKSSYEKLKSLFDPISDEYMLQQFALQLGEGG